MTLRILVAIPLLMLGALVLGWLVDQREGEQVESDLEIPNNIDYYLAEVKMRTFDTEGTLNYRLHAPYLEHFVREDVSQIRQPVIDYLGGATPWEISAASARLQHQDETIELEQAVKVIRKDPGQPFELASSRMLFDPNREIATIPVTLTMTSDTLNLTANSARLDLQQGQHQFERVSATYHDKGSNEPG